MLKNNLHSGHRTRMRERFIKGGADNLRDHELLELLLYYSIPRKDTNEIAHRLINSFGSLEAVFDADFNQLSSVEGIGENTAVLINLISGIKEKLKNDDRKGSVYLKTTEAIKEYAASFLKGKPMENLYAICLTNDRKVISSMKISEGNEDLVVVSSREIIQVAVMYKAEAMILAHNHPGGISYPSNDDIASTRKISDVLKGIDIELIDHIVVGEGTVMSLKSMNIF